MKVPVSWLKEYVNFDLTPEEFSDKFTFSGIEVEGIETVGEGLDDIVVGEIRSVTKHPNADRLRLCKVYNGQETLDVVCGAPNAAAGLKVPFARVGSVLPGKFKIKKAKIRGEHSYGMLCSPSELGLSGESEGLMALPASAETGQSIYSVIGEPETVFELEITWNRPDCLSMFGIAREIAALLGRRMKRPEIDLKADETAGVETVDALARVRVDDTAGCCRYTARLLKNVANVPSPGWMQKRLELCGVRPVNCAVDVTNYVMLECGQPLHAFDYGKLADQTIIVRRAAAGEKILTIDHEARDLDPEMLVIADAKQAVAVAGVMGGAQSEIGDDTRNVLLESATFDPASVKATATKLGMRSESSHRFERGVDPALADWASQRAASLLVQYAGATLVPGVIDTHAGGFDPTVLDVRPKRIRDVMGAQVAPDECVSILSALGFDIRERSDDRICVAVPSWRYDIEREADLVEEVVRMVGLDRVPAARPAARAISALDDTRVREVSRCRDALIGLGCREVVHYSFLSSDLLNRVTPGNVAKRLTLPNPVSADHGVMRDSLIPQMVETLGRNHAHQTDEASLFEIGRVFGAGAAGPFESERLCLGQMGPVGRGALERGTSVTTDEAFLWIKGVLESLCARLHVKSLALTEGEHEAMEPGSCANIVVADKPCGVIGPVKESLRHRWRVNVPVVVMELELDALLGRAFERVKVCDLPQYPSVSRDIAMVVDPSVTHESVVKTIRSVAPDELTTIELFDIFDLKEMGDKDRRSMAYSLTYQSPGRTLTDDEVNVFHNRVRAKLKDSLKVKMREG